MIALVVVGCIVAYTIVGAAVWERARTPRSARDLHPDVCGEEYRSIHSCGNHGLFDRECDRCWDVSFDSCIRHRCRAIASTDAAVAVAKGALWLPVLPVWVGVRLGRGKKIGGKRYKGAERLAKDIAKLEREIFGEGS